MDKRHSDFLIFNVGSVYKDCYKVFISIDMFLCKVAFIIM